MDRGLFDDRFLSSLAGLRLRLRRRRAADRHGDVAAGGRGGRTEFAGHRRYAPGDDLRALDWAAWARTGRLHVKEFERESVERVLVALDGSASMGVFGKWTAARRVAAALGAAALQEDARVDLWLLRDGGARRVAALRGRRGVPSLLEGLSAAACGGATDLRRSLAALPAPAPGGGRLALISDLLDVGGVGPPLLARCGRGEEPWLLELLAPEEREPRQRGTLLLGDPEAPGGSPLRLAVGDREAAAFAVEVARRVRDHGALARRLRGAHVPVSTEAPAAEVVTALVALLGGGRRPLPAGAP